MSIDELKEQIEFLEEKNLEILHRNQELKDRVKSLIDTMQDEVLQKLYEIETELEREL